MAETTISPLHWNMILEGINERECVPFLGAAVNVASKERGYEGLPLGGEVALRLVESLIGKNVNSLNDLASVSGISEDLTAVGLAPDLVRLGLENLPRVALHLEVQGGERPYLMQRVRQVLAENQREPSKLLQALADLPFRLIITTNFDRLMERALDKAFEQALPFEADQIRDAANFVAALQKRVDPLSKYLWGELPGILQEAVDNHDPAIPAPDALKASLAQELTRLIRGPLLFEKDRFAQVALPETICSLVLSEPSGTELVYLNRLLLEEAYPFSFARCRKPHQVVVQPTAGFKGGEQKRQLTDPPPDDVLVVYKIHGSFMDSPNPKHDDPSDVILTEEDYIRFLTVVGQAGVGVPNYVSSKLVHSRLLFLGYSLEDWDFRTLYKGLIETLPVNSRRTAFAIQWRPPKFWVNYWEKKQVIIYDYDVYRFADELEDRYVKRFGSIHAVKD
jgi:hypothetical protein